MFEPQHSIEDIVPEARPAFEALLKQAQAMGLQPSVGKNGAGRTCATQQSLKAQGPGVTGAGMCRSWHVLGRALDIDVSPNTCASYTKLGQLWESWGGTWGGRWSQFGACGDARHFQWSAGVAAVPETLCPSSVSLDECEALREKYLSHAFGASMTKVGMAIAVGGVAIAAVIMWRATR